MSYEEILKVFNDRRGEYNFPPSTIDNLPDNQRKEVEKLIIRNCLRGDTNCFNYLKIIKFYDVSKLFTVEELDKMQPEKKGMLAEILYEKTHNNIYLNYSMKNSSDNKETKKKREHFAPKTVFNIRFRSDDPEEQKKEMEELIAKRDKIFAEMGIDLEADKRKKIEKEIEKRKNKLYLEQMKSGILGFAVGDALGVPFEFKGREEMDNFPASNMVGYGTHYVDAGTWSDDTSLTLATMDSITEKKGIDCDDIMYKFTEWLDNSKYTATNKLFDIGMSTKKALTKYKSGEEAIKCGGKDKNDNGNGSLMRMLPVAFYIYDNNLSEIESIEIINKVSSLTHGNEISLLGCKIFCDYIVGILDGKNQFDSLEEITEKDYSKFYSKEALDAYKNILFGVIERFPKNKIKSTGYIVNTLEASIWATLNANSYEEAVLNAVNLGEDTDTIGAITGGINGIIYGKEKIPERWLNKMQNLSYLNEITDKYIESMRNNIDYKFY